MKPKKVTAGILLPLALAGLVPSLAVKAEAPDRLIARSLAAQKISDIKVPAIDYTQDARVPIPSFTLKEGQGLEEMPAFFLGAMNKNLASKDLGELTFADAPGLGKLPVGELRKFAEFDGAKVAASAEKSLEEVVPSLDKMKLSDFGLDKVPFAKMDFTKVGKELPAVTIADLGAANTALDKIIDVNTTAKDPSAKFIRIDRISTDERKGNQITSGSNREPIQKCGKSCDLAEFQSAAVKDNTNGIQAIINRPDTQKLPGGVGMFGRMISDASGGEWGGYVVASEESNLKYSFHRANAKEGSAIGQLNLRFCWDVWGFGKQCTQYFVGIPIGKLTEKGNSAIPFPLLVNAPIAAPKAVAKLAAIPAIKPAEATKTAILPVSTIGSETKGATVDRAKLFGPLVKSSESLIYGTSI